MRDGLLLAEGDALPFLELEGLIPVILFLASENPGTSDSNDSGGPRLLSEKVSRFFDRSLCLFLSWSSPKSTVPCSDPPSMPSIAGAASARPSSSPITAPVDP